MKRAVRIPEADLQPIRPLVVPVTPDPGESLAGLVARSTRLDVLRHPRIILAEVGLEAAGTGGIGTDIDGLEARLAQKIGCSVNDVVTRSTPFLAGSSDTEVAFGGSDILRFHLDLRHRWVSPARLGASNVHLSAWSCRLLPYCPQSLERLICRCNRCGQALGWVAAQGIDVCEHCLEPLRHPDGQKLSPSLVESYRAFASLISPEPAERDAARSALAREVQDLPQPVLINLIIGLGRSCREIPIGETASALLTQPELLVDVLSLGTELVHEFPRRLRLAIVALIEQIGWDEERPLRPLLRAIRNVANNATRPQQRQLIRDAVPEMFETAARALGGFRAPVLVAKDLARLGSLKVPQIKLLIKEKALDFSMAGTGLRPKLQFDKESTLDFISRLRNSTPSASLEARLGVPRYAIEQLLCTKELTEETHRAVSILYPGLRIAAPDDFAARLEAGKRTDEALATTISLARGVCRIGGRCKPWAAILVAMAKGQLDFWLIDQQAGGRALPFTKRAQVHADAIAAFDDVDFNEGAYPDFSFCDEISQLDACDLLNLDSAQINRIASTGALEFRTTAKTRLNVGKAQVLELAAQMISPAELSLRSGIHPSGIRRYVAQSPLIEPLHCGWRRADVQRAIQSLSGPQNHSLDEERLLPALAHREAGARMVVFQGPGAA